ncbi:MAG: AzlC family ABC transporter permease [Christensenellaceae bacterium]|nr:AzlC family ABC transporter permease [Christensenellaceae bacterium]
MSVLTFKKGIKDGLPIALGYLSVSFAFGILAVEKGLPVWSPILISFTNFTGTGQFAGADLMAMGAGLMEIAFTLLIINLRYLLMSLSLSQRISPKMGLLARLGISFGITDENFAVAIAQTSPLTGKYMAGLILTSFFGWLSGTALGALAGAFLPESLLSALGIALYAMFIAIIIPPCRENKAVLTVVGVAIVLSCLFTYIPALATLGSGWAIIICGVSSALLGAWLFPADDEADADAEQEADHE